MVTDYLVYLVVRGFVCLVQCLRLETCEEIAGWLGWLAQDVLRIRRRVVEENLRHAFPDRTDAWRNDLARRMWRHLFLMVTEIAHTSRKIHPNNWRDHVSLRDADVIMRGLYEDRPLLLVTGHYGNFETSGYMLGLYGFKTYVVARTLDNPFLDRFVNQFRASRGQRILPKQGSVAEIEKLLAENGALAVVADQHAGPKGCWVDFFGRPASAHKAIALFSLQHSAPMVVTYARRTGGMLQYEVGSSGSLDPRDVTASDPVRFMTEWFTRRLEEIIREEPSQYWWIHRRWKDKPAAAKKLAA
jgi:KDO2-lipid IV(A) lauroyltransferase